MKKRPKKPRGFPLTINPNGQWSKKIDGKTIYFGTWEEKDLALQKYYSYINERGESKGESRATTSITVGQIAMKFVEYKFTESEQKRISYATARKSRVLIKHFLQAIGIDAPVATLRPIDFTKAKNELGNNGLSIHRISEVIVKVKEMFRWAEQMDFISEVPKFGIDWKGRTKLTLEQQKRRESKFLSQQDVQTMMNIETSYNRQWKAIILIALNCAYGPKDISDLTFDNIKGEYISNHRSKTGIFRKAWLWPETIAAINEYLQHERPRFASKAKPEFQDRVFLTSIGNTWVATSKNSIYSAINRVLLKLKDKRLHIFYALRHTFRTIADETGDATAIRTVMGHVDNSVESHYINHISDERIKRVCEHVREWFYTELKPVNSVCKVETEL